ncbi:MAG: AraC family transcriptional regulator [Clostridia bacterium]|nr:AraC family transcriptional regulator [Clostridia bacterium]
MFDKKYICSPKGLPFVAFYKNLSKGEGEIFTKLHFHDDFEMLYICEGAAEFNIDGKRYVANKDTLVLVNPYETHSAKVIRPPLVYYCLDFDLSMLGMENAAALLNEEKKYKNIVKNNAIKPYLERACEAYFKTEIGWQSALRGNLLLIFSMLENMLENKYPRDNSFVKDTITYIDNNLSEPISSNTASKALGYNQSYFCRNFKKNFGYSFGEYLSILRIEKAKSMLATISVTETAEKCGFGSVSAFSQIFKKHTGFSPMKYKGERL